MTRNRHSLLWVLTGVLLWCLVAPLAALNGDTRYSIGTLRVAAAAGWSPSETWTHRPLANRLAMALFDRVHGGPLVFQELCWFALGTILACLAGALLRAGLARAGVQAAWPVALAVATALACAPARSYWQPEWLAVVLAVAGLGVLLGRVGQASLLAGSVLLALSALMKYTTISTGFLALTLLACWDLRRACRAALATGVVGALLFGLTLLGSDREWRWFGEMPGLASSSISWWNGLGSTLVDMAVVAPVLSWLLPAWAGTIVATRFRPVVVVLPTVGVASVLSTMVAQGQWYNYHLFALVVLAAGAGAAQLARLARGPVAPALACVVVSVGIAAAAGGLAAGPADWREQHVDTAALVLLAGVSVLTVVVVLTPVVLTAARHPTPVARWLIPLALCLLAVPLLPSAPFSYQQSLDEFTRTSELARRTSAEREAALIHQQLPPGTPLTYLSFGEQAYFIQNPSPCRYAAATFLQRSIWVDDTGMDSFAENLACLDDRAVSFVYVSTGWFKTPRMAPVVGEALGRNYDCAHAIKVSRTALLCPRR